MLENFDLIINTINYPKEVLIDLKNELENEIYSLQSSYDHDKFEEDKKELDLMNLRLQIVQVVQGLIKIKEGKNE